MRRVGWLSQVQRGARPIAGALKYGSERWRDRPLAILELRTAHRVPGEGGPFDVGVIYASSISKRSSGVSSASASPRASNCRVMSFHTRLHREPVPISIRELL